MAYSDNTLHRAEAILGYGIGSATAGVRTYRVVDGIIYTDLFTDKPVIDGYTGTLTTRFNGSQRTPYFNEIVLNDKCQPEVSITAAWGNDTFTTEVDDLLKWLEDNPFADIADNSSVQSKKIEDSSTTFKDSDEAGSSFYDAVRGVWSFYIRNPIIISVTPEQRHDYGYF
jgi:hypothetical protein